MPQEAQKIWIAVRKANPQDKKLSKITNLPHPDRSRGMRVVHNDPLSIWQRKEVPQPPTPRTQHATL